MTLIIAKGGKIYADRRMIRGTTINPLMTAHNRGDKIVKLPFGAYAISGAEPADAIERDWFHSSIINALAFAEYMDYIEKNFDNITTASGTTLEQCNRLGILHPDFFRWCGVIINGALQEVCAKNKVYIVAAIRSKVFAADPGMAITTEPQAGVAMGSAGRYADFFLTEDYEVDEIYKILSKHQSLHISKEYDTFDLSTLPAMIPDLTNWTNWLKITATMFIAFSSFAERKFKDNKAHVAGCWTNEERDIWSMNAFTLYRIMSRHLVNDLYGSARSHVVKRKKPRNWFDKDGNVNANGIKHHFCHEGSYSWVLGRIVTRKDHEDSQAAYEAQQKETENKKS